MAESDHGAVRATDVPFEKQSSTVEIYRHVDAPIVRTQKLDSAHVSVELLERRRNGSVNWRFRQDRHALFLFERGILGCDGLVDERTIRRPIRSESNLAFVAAGSPIDMAIDMSASCSYVAVFFDAGYTLCDDEDLGVATIPSSNVGFADPQVANSLVDMRREMETRDSVSRLMLEGLALRALALLHRGMSRAELTSAGALSTRCLQRVSDHMRERMAEDVSVEELAQLVGLSSRQFCRRFQASTGISPGRALRQMRLDRAAELLAGTRNDVMNIALDCGFSQPQHLATSFRRRFGVSPTSYRRAHST